jgi:cytidylate kinase
VGVICISRQLGAHGSLIGERVARALDYGLVDSEIVRLIANRSGLRPELLAEWDEHGPRSFLRRLLLDGSMVQGLEWGWIGTTDQDVYAEIERQRSADYVYLEGLQEILEEIGQAGNAVIVGRGAGFALRESCPELLHVQLASSESHRIAVVAGRMGISQKEASELVRDSDEQRRRFLEAAHQVDWRDGSNYDLVVNPGSLGVDAAEALILEAARRRFELPRETPA